MITRILSFFLCVGVLVFGIRSGVAQSEKKSLEEFQKKISKQKGRLKGLRKKEKSLLHEVHGYSRRISRLKKDLNSLSGQRTRVEKDIDQAERNISRLEKEIRKTRGNVSSRVRDLYMWKQPTYLRALLSAESMADLRQRKWYVRRWVEEDRRQIKKFEASVKSLDRERSELAKDQKELNGLIKTRRRKRNSLSGEKKNRSSLLSLVRNQKDYYRRSIDELQEAAKNLEKLIQELQKAEREGASRFARMRGRLPWPVQGKVEKRFGSYRDKKIKARLHHKGLDIRAKRGTPIRAVFDGTVVYADWFVGYGKILILDHGGGFFTLYAHIENLQKNVGDEVTVNETIASVGESGSLKGSYLYFELRHKGISKDPWPWLSRRGR